MPGSLADKWVELVLGELPAGQPTLPPKILGESDAASLQICLSTRPHVHLMTMSPMDVQATAEWLPPEPDSWETSAKCLPSQPARHLVLFHEPDAVRRADRSTCPPHQIVVQAAHVGQGVLFAARAVCMAGQFLRTLRKVTNCHQTSSHQ